MTRRGATGLAGILPVDKPAGPTSHDIVAQVRRATGEGRIGHAGTLDPAAEGLLVLLLGPYTRLEPYLSSGDKSYEAVIAFGSATDTDDAAGAVVETAPVPGDVSDESRARQVLASFLGPSRQAPPAYSAIKRDGVVAHRAARSGAPLDLEERGVTVSAADLLGIDAEALTWRVRFDVSKGTYVRALARDLGRACGTVAHLAWLRRTRSGTLDVTRAHGLDEVLAAASAATLPSLFADPVAALGLPVVSAPSSAVADGRRPPRGLAPSLADGDLVTLTVAGRLAGVYRAEGDLLVSRVVIPAEVDA